MIFKNILFWLCWTDHRSVKEKRKEKTERGADRQRRSLVGFKSGKLQLHGILLRPLGHQSV